MLHNRFIRIFIIIAATLGVFFVTIFTFGSEPHLIAIQFPINEKTIHQSPLIFAHNLTDVAGEQIVKKLITSVTDGKQGDEWKPDTDAIVKTALASVIDSFDPEDIFPIVKSSSLTIDPDQSLKNQLVYFAKLLKVLEVINNTNADAAIATHTKAVADLYAIPVPQRLVEIHREAIISIGAQKNILTFLKTANDDPLQALLVAESESLVNEQIQTLYKEIADRVSILKKSAS